MASQRSLVKNSIYNIFYALANVLFPLVTSMYVSRILLAEGCGQVAYAQSIAAYFVAIASLGIPIYGIREVAKAKEEPERLNKLYTELFIINTVATLLSCLVYVVLMLSVGSFREEFYLFGASGLLILLNLFNVDWLYKGLEDYKSITTRSLFIKTLFLIALLLFVKTKADYIIYALLLSLSTGIPYFINIVTLRKKVKFDFKGLKVKPHLYPIICLAGCVVLESIYGKIDMTMLGILTADRNVGLYNYAHKTVTIVITVCTAITTVLMPRLSALYVEDREKFDKLVQRGLKVLIFITIPAAVGLLILAPEVMSLLYGKEFLAAGNTVRVFTALIIICGFGDLLCYQLLICTGNESKRVLAALIATIVNIILNLTFIPFLQEIGAAIASVISELIANGILFIQIRKTVKIKLARRALVEALVSTAIMTAVIFLCQSLVKSLSYGCLITVFVGIAVYFIMNLIFGNEFVKMVFEKLFKKSKKEDGEA